MKSVKAPFAAVVVVLNFSPAPPNLIHTAVGLAFMNLKQIMLLSLEKTTATA